MEIDIYQQCPCHDNKKIKFCCGKDVVPELNKILEKNSSGQPAAALTRIAQALAESGPRDCLLTLQAHIMISNGQIAEARVSNRRFRETKPDHPTGLQHLALIHLAEGDTPAAVNSLQDSMEAIKGDTIPLSVANVFRIFGIALARRGNVFSARSHLSFAISLKPEDQELQQILFQTFRFPELPLLLKGNFYLQSGPQSAGEDGSEETPEDAPEWVKKFALIHRVAERGQFRKALRGLKKLNQMQPDQQEIVHGIALFESVLCNGDAMSGAWREYSRVPSLSQWQKVEGEAVAQLVDTEPAAGSVPVIRATYQLDSIDSVLEKALSNERIVSSPDAEDVFNEGPAPKASFFVLDMPEVTDPEMVTVENVPSVMGEMFLFGKQTDRSARIECVATADQKLDSVLALVAELRGPSEPEQSELATADRAAMALTWNWHLPKGVTRAAHAELVEKFRDISIRKQWANLPFAVLGGKTPLDAAKDPGLKVALQAMLLNLEVSTDSQLSEQTSADIFRNAAGLDPMPTVPVEELEDPRGTVSPVQQQYLDFEKLSDDQVLRLYSDSMALGNVPVLRKLMPMMIERESLHESIPLDVSYSMRAELTLDDEKALEYLSTARTHAKERGQAVGSLLVQELEQRMSRGISEKLPALMERIQRYHMSEPGVEQQLGRVLQRFGVIDERGRATSRSEDVPAPAGGEALWTGDAAEPAESAESTESGESKLWLPPS